MATDSVARALALSAGGGEDSRIPAAPGTDGTYTLTCTVTSGVPAYSWAGGTPTVSGISWSGSADPSLCEGYNTYVLENYTGSVSSQVPVSGSITYGFDETEYSFTATWSTSSNSYEVTIEDDWLTSFTIDTEESSLNLVTTEDYIECITAMSFDESE